MSFIYHRVPTHLIGETLLPLFELEKEHPLLFQSEIEKYGDHPKRKELPFKNLKKLDCPRGAVLHCSPIHPNLIFSALKLVFPDGNKDGNRSVNFFKIPIERIEGIPTILFDLNRPGYVFGEEEPEDIFDWITPDTYQEITVVPKAAFEFYWEWHSRGEPGAPAWGKIPHIMVKGRISIAGCEVVDWRDPLN